MVAAFDAHVELRSHRIETAGLAPAEVLALAEQGLASGRFRLGAPHG
jgi:hypothetical protein